MAQSVVLAFAVEPDEEEVLDLVVEMGGHRRPDPTIDGLLQDEPGAVWINVRPSSLDPDDDIWEQYRAKLGRPAAHLALVTVSREPGSEDMALDFLVRAARRWRFVLGSGDEVFEVDDAVERARSTPNEGSWFFP